MAKEATRAAAAFLVLPQIVQPPGAYSEVHAASMPMCRGTYRTCRVIRREKVHLRAPGPGVDLYQCATHHGKQCTYCLSCPAPVPLRLKTTARSNVYLCLAVIPCAPGEEGVSRGGLARCIFTSSRPFRHLPPCAPRLRKTCQPFCPPILSARRGEAEIKLTGSLLLPHDIRSGIPRTLELGAALFVALLLHVAKTHPGSAGAVPSTRELSPRLLVC